MGMKMRIFKAEIKKRREGITIGLLTGAALAYYAVSQGADLNSIVAAGEGLLDGVLGRNATAIQLAQYKVYGVFMTVGAVAGYYLDIFYDKSGLPIGKRRSPARRVRRRRRK